MKPRYYLVITPYRSLFLFYCFRKKKYGPITFRIVDKRRYKYDPLYENGDEFTYDTLLQFKDDWSGPGCEIYVNENLQDLIKQHFELFV